MLTKNVQLKHWTLPKKVDGLLQPIKQKIKVQRYTIMKFLKYVLIKYNT